MTRFVFTCQAAHFDLTLFEFQRADGTFSFLQRLSEDVGLAETALAPAALAETVRKTPVIFVRHLFAVTDVLPRGADAQAVFAAALPHLSEELSVSVQTRFADGLPFDAGLTPGVSQRLAEHGFAVDVAGSRRIVSVFAAADAVYVGVGDAEENLTHRSGGEPHYARAGFGFVSRAEFKLREAAEVFGIDFAGIHAAVDLGAAPGGWTKVLAEQGIAVTAIDPSRLKPQIERMENVTYRQMRAEDFLKAFPDSRFDLAVNDMKLDVRQSTRVMDGFWPLLNAGALAVMTMKLPKDFSYREILSGLRSLSGYALLGARQLFHNRSEITLFLRRRDEMRKPEPKRGEKTGQGGLSKKLAKKYGNKGKRGS